MCAGIVRTLSRMLYCDEQQNPLGKGTGCAVPIQPARTDDFDVVETEVLRLQVYDAVGNRTTTVGTNCRNVVGKQ